jgi:hypothetical protein
MEADIHQQMESVAETPHVLEIVLMYSGCACLIAYFLFA